MLNQQAGRSAQAMEIHGIVGPEPAPKQPSIAIGENEANSKFMMSKEFYNLCSNKLIWTN